LLPFDLDSIELRPSKHFRNTKMRKWDWDVHDLRECLRSPIRVVRRGSSKVEVWVRKDGSKKLVLAYSLGENVVLIITGTEG
jgi:hypothetical protein